MSFRGRPAWPELARGWVVVSNQALCLFNPKLTSFVHTLLFVLSAGELTEEEIETVKTIIAQPTQFGIPLWFLNRQKDVKTGKNLQLTANQVDTKYREDLERMKKIRYVVLYTLVCLLARSCLALFMPCCASQISVSSVLRRPSLTRPLSCPLCLQCFPR